MGLEDGNERAHGSARPFSGGSSSSGGGHRAGSELFVCFPSRTHMNLLPKPILSPGRSGDPAKRLRSSAGRGQSSPMFSIQTNGRSEGRNKNSEYEIEEPSSPKVTCAGQVRVKPRQCKSWQSVMAEIEKLHGAKQRKNSFSRAGKSGGTPVSSPGRVLQQPKWSQVVGLKKEVVQFITALRNLRVDLGCFGASSVSTDDEEEEEEDDEARRPSTSGTVFAKWFMILQDSDDRKEAKPETSSVRSSTETAEEVLPGDSNEEPAVPPPNALLLMRCRSAPSLNYTDSDITGRQAEDCSLSNAKNKSPSNAVVLMRCETDFSKLSLEVSKETWVSKRDFTHQTFMRSVSLKG